MTWQYHSPTFDYEQLFEDSAYPWAGHKRFAYDLIRNRKPAAVVELGTYKGTSLFSFAQAVKDAGITTTLYAVDTWEGDAHAGEYGEDVYEGVVRIRKEHYPSVDIRLLRKTFDEALADMEDGTVDVLHIDGLHTYEAVRHDFETWKNKLKPDGIILFHDTEERHDDFGVWKFWAEVSKNHPHVNFYHSHGLGVLFLGAGEEGMEGWTELYGKRWELENARKEIADKTVHIRNLEAERIELKDQAMQMTQALEHKETEAIELRRIAQEYAIVKLSLSYKLMRFQGSITNMIRHPGRTLNDMRLAMQLLRREGMGSFMKRAKAYLQGYRLPADYSADGIREEEAYQEYMKHEGWAAEEEAAFAKLLERDLPLISILLPVYGISPDLLRRCVNSVKNQRYPRWELCIYDDASKNPETIEALKAIEAEGDPRIKVRFGTVNQNISGSTNEALKLATGDYISLLDHDDELHPLALAEVMKAIVERDPDVIYTDEDYIDLEGKRFSPHFKPDFSPDLLLAHNYITHLLTFRRSLMEDEAQLFRLGVEGAQDHDLVLRLTEKTARIHHIPKVLYHWRYMEESTSKNPHSKPEALHKSRKVLEDAIKRRGLHAHVEEANAPFFFHTRYEVEGTPLVSIIIPFKDKPELLKMSVESVLQKSTYQHYEIIGVSNNSTDPETFKEMERLAALDPRVRFIKHDVEFNFAEINNFAIRQEAKGEHVIYMNNDIEIITPGWIEALLELSQRPEVGAVGAKLYYPNDTIQHAGVVLGIGGIAGHAFKCLPRRTLGYFNKPNLVHNVTAVTGALLMVKRSIFDEMEGMDEGFKVAFNDVDFCVRIQKAGYRNLFTPHAEAYHHESISRGHEDTKEKQERFAGEIAAFRAKHGELLESGDPFYSPNLTLTHEDYRLKRW